jgi:hypothetical protein
VDDFRVWARANYVLSWVREEQGNLPLVTTGDPKNKVPGAIGQPGTTVLFGDAGIGFRTASGMRLTLGTWINAESTIGIEAAGFGTEQRANDFFTASDITGNPLLAVPFINQTTQPPGPSAHVISNPLKTTGDVLVAASLQRWGVDVSGIYCFWRQSGAEFSVLAGMRYEDLLEGLRILQHSLTISTKTNTTFDDHFNTRNQFFGAQAALRFHWQHDIWVFDATSKVAVGTTHQVVNIQGDSSQFGAKAAPMGSFSGGLFTQPSNIGQTAANPAVAIPSLELKLAYQLTPRLRVFAGYEVLYWNQVVRPSDQIDRNINLSQSVLLGTTQGLLSGPAQPAPLFHRSGFWAQEMNFGMEFRF